MVGDALGRCRAKIADHVQGRLEVLWSRAAAVRCKKRDGGGQVRTSVGGEPSQAANEGLVRLTATDKGLVVFVDRGGWGGVDGAPGAIRGREWIEVDACKTVGLDYVLRVGLLGKMDGQRAILMGRPLKVCSEEPVDGSHELDFELGSE